MIGRLIPWHYGDAHGVHYVRWWRWLDRDLLIQVVHKRCNEAKYTRPASARKGKARARKR